MTIGVGVNGAYATTSGEINFMDIDGDGLPDHVLRMGPDRNIYVKRNAMGEAGLLKVLSLQQGGTYPFTYVRAGNTTDMPQSRWILDTLTKDDGTSSLSGDRGAHSYKESYSYADGYYDRTERMFYGFASVTTTKGDNATKVSYKNTNQNTDDGYYTRTMSTGSELRSAVSSGEGVLYQTSSAEVVGKSIGYGMRLSTGVLVEIKTPRVSSETSRQYEAGKTTECAETAQSYEYSDDYRNVTSLHKTWRDGASSRELTADIEYDLSIPGADYRKQHRRASR